MIAQIELVRPIRTITFAFLSWKFFLLGIAIGSSLVGEMYDTSVDLLLEGAGLGQDGTSANATSRLGHGASNLVKRFGSWDAVWLVGSARLGHIYEQQWAFGQGLPMVMSWLVKVSNWLAFGKYSRQEASPLLELIAGVLVANASHLLSAFVLYHLTWLIWHDGKLALVAALLHIISPAGAFLSAPYAESSFALLSFLGHLFYALGHDGSRRQSTVSRDGYTILSGLVFGLSSFFRSNGILNGMPFAVEALYLVFCDFSSEPSSMRRLLVLGIGGAFVAAGTGVSQLTAYLIFCTGTTSSGVSVDPRPWCTTFPPSIFTYVQSHYWDVGFLKYWSLENIPLFILAAPMLWVLAKSGIAHMSRHSIQVENLVKRSAPLARFVWSMAAAQVLLAALALTTYHVQIITRISSAYPIWYWWLASHLISGSRPGLASGIVKFMVMYAGIQGALFASFLPPA